MVKKEDNTCRKVGKDGPLRYETNSQYGQHRGNKYRKFLEIDSPNQWNADKSQQIEQQIAQKGPGDLKQLLYTGQVWEISAVQIGQGMGQDDDLDLQDIELQYSNR